MSKFDSQIATFATYLGDDMLVLGHRLSEWCGHGPMLEEDIALTNIALDCVGQAKFYFDLAGRLENQGRDADKLAYWRDEREFKNCVLVELPKGDFGVTILRQFLYETFYDLVLADLTNSKFEPLKDLALRAKRETNYHLKHTTEWIYRLGTGTAESHKRMQVALDYLYRYTAELFADDEVLDALSREQIAPKFSSLKQSWVNKVQTVLQAATLEIPTPVQGFSLNGRLGRHSEHLGHMLSEMQIVARSHPGATW
ncbi:phenylacetate-CoA oxygenase subunit PaaC [bacterium]|nr:phenylacetate-CoA oxygenase subunit PaaC [bacterium]